MIFTNRNYFLSLIILFFSTDIFAGMLILPQPKYNKSFKTKTIANTSNNKNAVADRPTANPATMEQIKKDWASIMSGALIPNLDDSMSWAGGTLTRIAPGKMEYVNKSNGYFSEILDSNTDIAALANKCGDINAAWITQYGVDLGGGMGMSPNSQDQRDANIIAVDHTYMYGVSSTFTKDEPFPLGFGIGAFNDNGNTKYVLKGQVLDLNQLKATNQYKALTGANMVYSLAESNSNKKELPLESSSTDHSDYNKKLLEQKKTQLAQALAAVELIKKQIAQLGAIIKTTQTAIPAEESASESSDPTAAAFQRQNDHRIATYQRFTKELHDTYAGSNQALQDRIAKAEQDNKAADAADKIKFYKDQAAFYSGQGSNAPLAAERAAYFSAGVGGAAGPVPGHGAVLTDAEKKSLDGAFDAARADYLPGSGARTGAGAAGGKVP